MPTTGRTRRLSDEEPPQPSILLYLSHNNYAIGVLFRVDFAGSEPLFRQLADQVRAAAAAGDLRPGERLPAARDLADSLNISLHTVLHAYQELRDEGLIELRRGRGAVVTSAAAQDLGHLRNTLATAATEARRLGLSQDTTIGLLKEAFR